MSRIQGVIFDLDGVLVSTDEQHYRAWKQLADEEGIPFDREINHRLRGVSRMQSLDIVLERATRAYTKEERDELAARKNAAYRRLLSALSPSDVLPGALPLLAALKAAGVRTAVGSSSRNAPLILARIGLSDAFDAVVDGNDIARSKPDPEVFLLAARRLSLAPEACAVVEDARAGIDAAKAARCRAVAVGYAADYPLADAAAPDLLSLDLEQLLDS